jgi:tRNA(Ile)-lysidine synthase
MPESSKPLKPGPATQRVAHAVAGAFERHREALSDGPLVVAVSGGPDSTALLWGLLALPVKERPALVVAHFSHGLRPRAEPREAILVERIVARWGIPMVHGVANMARRRRGSLEAAARDDRYAFLLEMAHQHGAKGIVLGHTLDDQAETVLLRLTRGTGLRGAGAMAEWTPRGDEESPVALFRPLLEVTRQETVEACAEAGLTPLQDPSNRSLAFSRNRVRLKVLPELERLNPEVRSALAHYAALAQQDHALLDSLARSAVLGKEQRAGGAITWPRRLLAEMPHPLAVRVIQSAWEELIGLGAVLSSAHQRAVGRLFTGASGRKAVLPYGMVFSATYSTCCLGPPLGLEMLPAGEVSLRVPGLTVFGPWEVEVLEQGGDQTQPTDGRSCVHIAVTDGGLKVRNRRKGDRFHPVGMSGSKRLQDFFVDAKVPRWERDAVPLVVASQGIAWIVGHRVAAWAQAVDTTPAVHTVTFRKRQGS